MLDAVGDIVVEDEGLVDDVEKFDGDTVPVTDTDVLAEPDAEIEFDAVVVLVTVYDADELLDAVGDIVVEVDGLIVDVEKFDAETVTDVDTVLDGVPELDEKFDDDTDAVMQPLVVGVDELVTA